ncbi:MAG: O-acetyl-ADP-ribose deacetylase [Bacteroidales bacterium]|nr:O-acetyl-ADP-ribose deacetylase [Deltaproteobacteria bacterium]MBL7137550.1 O-acetyl-ADP-ribose deacetylase [Bacteroidales bacterium]
MKSRIELVLGDITKVTTDAIVNAANRSLLGGGGVDGAIHRAAGPALLEACRMLEGCETGQAKITEGFQLPASHVIHTVGPIWYGGNQQEKELLAACYRNSLELARDNGCTTIAFPNISTGIYRFPKKEAARIAIAEVKKYLFHNKLPEKVFFVCFDEENFNLYEELLDEGLPTAN